MRHSKPQLIFIQASYKTAVPNTEQKRSLSDSNKIGKYLGRVSPPPQKKNEPWLFPYGKHLYSPRTRVMESKDQDQNSKRCMGFK